MRREIKQLRSLRHYLAKKQRSPVGGYALPTVIALGISMLALSVTSVLLAQDGRDSAATRRDSAASFLISDSAIADILASFSLPENQILLGRNFDPINPATGTNYLGPDGIPN
ncbi:MAG: hypothetical protein AAGB01_07110, partial [Cyanobacteria bacterium P01_F01_bin.42]